MEGVHSCVYAMHGDRLKVLQLVFSIWETTPASGGLYRLELSHQYADPSKGPIMCGVMAASDFDLLFKVFESGLRRYLDRETNRDG